MLNVSVFYICIDHPSSAWVHLSMPPPLSSQGIRRELGPERCRMNCEVCCVHCTLYSVHCTVYTVQCSLYSVHCNPIFRICVQYLTYPGQTRMTETPWLETSARRLSDQAWAALVHSSILALSKRNGCAKRSLWPGTQCTQRTSIQALCTRLLWKLSPTRC